jgi:hypothetical protein
MNIKVVTPPAHTSRSPYRPRFNWRPLTDALRSSALGTWLSVPMAELPDHKTPVIQIGIHTCARRAGAKVQTKVGGDSMLIHLYAKD